MFTPAVNMHPSRNVSHRHLIWQFLETVTVSVTVSASASANGRVIKYNVKEAIQFSIDCNPILFNWEIAEKTNK